jgi:hypothetical protein
MHGVARIGWSWLPNLDLRELKRKRATRGLNKEERAAWQRSNIFLDRVSKGDLLFYRNQPEQGLVTIVKVTGDYEYHPSAPDFRSRRKCKRLKLALPLEEIPARLRRHLTIRGRLNEIHDPAAVESFYKMIMGKPADSKLGSGGAGSQRGGGAPKGGHTTSYLRPEKEVVVRQRHQSYEKSLNSFLIDRHIKAIFEQNHVDVAFVVNSHRFLGEIKVTNPPNAKDAFRMALGQLFEYRHLHFGGSAVPIMFLDHKLDRQRLALATQLGVAVVFDSKGKFALQNPEASAELVTIFPTFTR